MSHTKPLFLTLTLYLLTQVSVEAQAAKPTLRDTLLSEAWSCGGATRTYASDGTYKIRGTGYNNGRLSDVTYTGKYSVDEVSQTLTMIADLRPGFPMVFNVKFDTEDRQHMSIYQGSTINSICITEKRQEAIRENEYQAKQARAQQPQIQERHYVVAGGVICTNPNDFNRVNAVERSGNPYAQLPPTCETVGANLPVNFIRSVNNLFLVGNEGGAAYVRIEDYR